MRTATRLLTAGLLAFSVAAGPASQSSRAADFSIELTPGDSASVDSGAVAGANAGHFAGTEEGYPCPAAPTPAEFCQTILVHVTNPFDEAEAKKGRERATLDLVLAMDGAGDLSLQVYESDADGNRGDNIGGSDGLGEASEAAAIAVTTTADDQEEWLLVEVFFHAYTGSWTLDASFA